MNQNEEEKKQYELIGECAFFNLDKKDKKNESNYLASPTPEDLIEKAHIAATGVLIEGSDDVKTEILKGAEQVVHNKTEEIKNRAELQAKKALFENNKGACGCFGFEEETTEKWAVNFMKIWNRFFTLLYLIVGAFTFAPVLFISVKIRAIVKRAWVAVLLALMIYLIIVLSPVWINLVSNIKAK